MIFRLALLLSLLALLSPSCSAAAPAQEFRIGVLSFRDKAQTTAQWQATADELGARIPGARFRIAAMFHSELDEAVASQRLDFVITNPEHYIRLETLYRVTRLATLARRDQGILLQQFGGAIVVRSNRRNLRQPADLKGKTVAAVEPFALGAYMMQAGALLDLGIDAKRDLKMLFLGLPQDKSVAAVMTGQADAAFVRAGLVEQMEREGKLPPGALTVIGRRDDPAFPYAHSTPLLPEWPLAVLPHTAPELANRVTAHLLMMPPDGPAARQGRYYRWTVPVSYAPVADLMRRLGAPPFDRTDRLRFADILDQHAEIVIAFLLLASGAILVVALRMRRLNRDLGGQIVLASRRSRELEQEMVARREAEAQSRLQASVFANAQECLLITDAARNIVAINDAALAITGYRREELLGVNPRIFKSGIQDDTFYRDMWHMIDRHGFWSGEVWNRRKDGTLYACILKISALRDESGRALHYIGSQEDITALKESQRNLERLARYDELTGLANRHLLHDRMELALAAARRSGQQLAVCLLDLDGFKEVNDTFGHEAGDRLLIDIAHRLQQAMRETDTVARLGGDEFVLLLNGVDTAESLPLALDRVLAAMRPALAVDGQAIAISASIGVTLYPADAAAGETLLRHADEAMYQAKRAGRNRYHVFDPISDSAHQEHRRLLQELEAAIAGDELRLHYQPKVHLPTGRILGYEALVRWQHAERGLLPPAQFLPAVGKTALICAIDEWVMEQALTDLASWLAAGRTWHVSVNIAAYHFEREGFAASLQALLARHPEVPPHLLELELLESDALVSLDAVRDIIRACRALGVRTALDDFGTGYASLTYFKRLPVDTLKIDQSFVRGIVDDPESLAIVDNVVRLANAFQRDVVAEGMETAELGEMLCRFGCEVAQGYGLARPMPFAAVAAWADDYRPDPRWVTAHANSSDLSLLVVENEVRTWVDEIRRFLQDGRLAIPLREVADTRCCHLGRWYRGQGRASYGHHPVFADIGRIHDELHKLGTDVIDRMRNGRHDDARTIFRALEETARRLQSRMEALQAIGWVR